MMKASAAVLTIALVVVACSSVKTSDARVNVTAAFYPLAYLAERIGGSAVSVTNITPAGAEPHDLELRPSDVVAIRGAKLVLYLRGFQPAVDDAVRAMKSTLTFDALAALSVRRLPGGAVDPHFWLDPTLLSKVAHLVQQRLELADRSDRVAFRTNLAHLDADLGALDTAFRKGLAHCAHREIFTGHTAFGYLAARYKLRQIGITGLNPEAEPSPRQLTKIIQLARGLRPTVIFAEQLVSSRSVDAVARSVGAKVAVLNPLEGLTAKQRNAGDDYFSLMRSNLAVLQRSLGCRAT
jgi:zinc transport system substrate-binding protein